MDMGEPNGYEPMALASEASMSSPDEEPDYVMVEPSPSNSRPKAPFKRKRWIVDISFQLPQFCGGSRAARLEWGGGAADAQDEEEDRFEEARLKQEEIDGLGEEETDVMNRKADLNAFLQMRMDEINEELDGITKRRLEKERLLEEMINPPHLVNPLPKPKCLHFVEGSCFLIFADLVIIANIVLMVEQVTNEAYVRKYGKINMLANHAFMIWYVGELALRACLWRGQFLCGESSRIFWNLLDLGIVISGAVELWIYPLLLNLGVVQGGREIVQWLRFLRVCRLLRVLKLLHGFLESDLSWAQGHDFQVLMMCVIALNCIIIGMECDMPDYWIWRWVEPSLLAIFSFEITVRLKYQGCHFFYDQHDWVWNWLDFIIVAGGVIDQWMMPAAAFLNDLLSGHQASHEGSQMGKLMMMLRMARLLRILRLIRLIHGIAPLYQLIVSVIQAMQGMMWVLVLTIVILYIVGLLAVRLISHGIVFGGTAPPEVEAIFPTVPEAIFVLFNTMNGDWDCLEPLFEAWPVSQLLFMLFTVVSSWAILSILTAVVSENMIQASENHRQELAEQQEVEKLSESRVELERLFEHAEKQWRHLKDSTVTEGHLTARQYDAMLEHKGLLQQLKDLTGLDKGDLKLILDFQSKKPENSPEWQVKKKAFVEGLQNEHREVSERSIMRLEKRLDDLERALQRRVGDALEKQETLLVQKNEGNGARGSSLLAHLFGEPASS